MARPKSYPYPENMTYDRTNGVYVVRNPITGKRKTFSDEDVAIQTAKKLNEFLAIERQRKLLDDGRMTWDGLIDWWNRDRLPFMPWDVSTRTDYGYKLERIKNDFKERAVADTDCLAIAEWLGFCKTANQWNKWLYVWNLLGDFAVSKKVVDVSEPRKVLERSESKKLEINRKVRQRLEMPGFIAIHEKAEPWLQIAMEQSLITLQARAEICNMKHSDYRDGYLYVIRDKTSGDSEMAFIRIALTDELEEIRRRALKLDAIASPYLIHRRPERERRDQIDSKPHWTYITPQYMSRAFQEAREASGYYAHLEPAQRPTFHEIRSLGARLYKAQGRSIKDNQELMTHSDPKTTKIYLEEGAKALTDEHFKKVSAPMRLADVWSKR